MACIRVRRENSPAPIASTGTRRYSAQVGHTSTVCSTVSSGRSTSVVTPERPFPLDPMQEPPELIVSGEDLRHTEREDAMTSFQPLLKEGTYRRNDAGTLSAIPRLVVAAEFRPGVASPRANRACVQGLLPPDPTVAGQQGGSPLRGRSCGIPAPSG
ncbi:hypothetical protein PYW07_015178 [Mythimna separata]|uniref:Uncharacterized protein n=1 Tax=Mythimna separata TaxID=271217 RepID=A0AAD7YX91_MYTSE|nr:hypothetical protein PYW07_015178 [Mythimna separata]